MRSKKSLRAPLIYPRFSVVPRMIPFAAITSSEVVSNGFFAIALTPEMSGELAPATTASMSRVVFGDGTCATMRSLLLGMVGYYGR